MTWTYSPVSTTTDQVRLLVGDTEESDPLLQNEEIAFILTIESGVYYAAARAAEAIAAMFARKVATTVGDLSIAADKKFDHYTALAVDLRRRATISDCLPFAGGISISDKQSQEQNTDRVPPFFTRNDARNPQAPRPTPSVSTQ